MRNLMRVSFRRWMRQQSTLYCLIAVICCSVVNCVTVYSEKVIGTPDFDVGLFRLLMTCAMLITCAAVLLSRSESDPVRNAVIAGYSKAQILLAEIPAALLFACIAALVMLLPMLRQPAVLQRFPAGCLLLGAFGILLMFCAAALLTLICSLNLNSRILAVLFAAGCLLGGIPASDALCKSLMEQKTLAAAQFLPDENHEIHLRITDELPNPDYISPPYRTAVTALTLLLPQSAVTLTELYLETGIIPESEYAYQEKEILSWQREQCESLLRLLPLFELGMIMLITWLGLLGFRNRDMN